MTRHDELRKYIEYQIAYIKGLKSECRRQVNACKRLIANFQQEIDTESDYKINTFRRRREE